MGRSVLWLGVASLLTVGLLGCSEGGSTAAVGSDEEIVWSREFNEGEVLVYDMTMDQSLGEEGSLQAEGTMTMTTDEVTDETVTITNEMAMNVTEATGMLADMEQMLEAQLNGPPTTTVTDLDGNPLESSDADAMDVLGGLDFSTLDYPTRVGESVTQTLNGAATTTTLERIEERDGMRIAVLSSTSEMSELPEGTPDTDVEMDVTNTGETEIEIATGKMLRMSVFNSVESEMGSMSSTITMTLRD